MTEPDDDLVPPNVLAMRAALNRKTLKPECPVCGENHWGTPEGTNLIHAGASSEGVVDWGLGLEAIAAFCMNCGYIRFHATIVLGAPEPGGETSDSHDEPPI